MTLDEAIKILQEPGIPWSGETLENHYKARRLLIEAGKRIQSYRARSILDELDTLPGEDS